MSSDEDPAQPKVNTFFFFLKKSDPRLVTKTLVIV